MGSAILLGPSEAKIKRDEKLELYGVVSIIQKTNIDLISCSQSSYCLDRVEGNQNE